MRIGWGESNPTTEEILIFMNFRQILSVFLTKKREGGLRLPPLQWHTVISRCTLMTGGVVLVRRLLFFFLKQLLSPSEEFYPKRDFASFSNQATTCGTVRSSIAVPLFCAANVKGLLEEITSCVKNRLNSLSIAPCKLSSW